MNQRCKMPECGKHATTTWAQVPVCGDHREVIRAETMRFYSGKLNTYDDRVEYAKIAKLIPRSQVSLGDGVRGRLFPYVTCPDCGMQVGSNWLVRHKCAGGAAT